MTALQSSSLWHLGCPSGVSLEQDWKVHIMYLFYVLQGGSDLVEILGSRVNDECVVGLSKVVLHHVEEAVV